MVGQDGITDSNMASSTFVVVSIQPEPAKSSSMVQFAMSSLCFESLKFWKTDLSDWFCLVARCRIRPVFESG